MVFGEAVANKSFPKAGFTIHQFIFFVKMPGCFKVGRGVTVYNKRTALCRRKFLIKGVFIWLLTCQNSIIKS